MTITINKDSFPRFTKRLKKSLQKNGIELPLHQVQIVAAQSLGKENLYELNTLFDKSNNNHVVQQTSVEYQDIMIKDCEWFIEQASLHIGIGIGRVGQSIGTQYIKEAVIKSLQHILAKNQKVTLTLDEAQNLVQCYDGDYDTDITISRMKDDNKLYGWFKEYPEEGAIALKSDQSLPVEMQLLTPTIQLPFYENSLLCILGAFIIGHNDVEKLIQQMQHSDTQLQQPSSSYRFYIDKSPYFANFMISDIIKGHNYNLTVILSLWHYIKNHMKDRYFNLDNLQFLQKKSPLIWYLLQPFKDNIYSESIELILNKYYEEKNSTNNE